MAEKIFFVTDMSAHYTVKLYELLSQKLDIEFYFTGGEETYSDKRNKTMVGNFKKEYLSGVFLLPKFRFTPKLPSILFKKYDVIIKTIDDRFALPLTFLCAKLLRRPFIFWVGLWHHPETFVHRLSRFFIRMIYLHSDALVVYGEHIKRYLVGLGVPEGKIFIAQHAVNNDLFNKEVPAEEKQRLKEKMGLLPGKVILYVGRFETCKGLTYLIEAASRIKDMNYTLLFIGSGSEQGTLEDECRKRGCPYKFLGHIPNSELYRYYAIADVFVLPSIATKDFKEPWGLVVNEAMNQGCPVIATDTVGAAAGGLIVHGKSGFVVPERNTAALKEAIEKILEDEHLRRNMGKSSREMIASWTPERMAQGFFEAINFVAP